MNVLVLASQKGGAGKTTMAAHLAVAAAQRARVLLIDTDPQRTLTTWWRARAAAAPELAQVAADRLAAAMPGLRASGYGLVVVDTPPAATAAIAAVVAVADLVLIPVRPSPADLWAVGATVALCRAARRAFAFALSDATRGALATVQAAAALSEHGVVAPAILHRRVAYAAALGSGHAAQEIDRGPTATEVAGLLRFVLGRMQATDGVER